MYRTLVAALVALSLAPDGAAATASSGDMVPDSVRIRILDGVSVDRMDVGAANHDLLVYVAGTPEPILHLPAATLSSIERRGAEVRLQGDGGTVQGTRLHLVSRDDSGIDLLAADVSRSYRGRLTVDVDDSSPSGLRIVNSVHLEDYVMSVVASEYGLDDLEGAKAMAVVARTYAVRGLAGRAAPYDHVDHEAAQVYRGAGPITQIARLATETTRGEILTYAGSPIEAVYSSSSGGHTASNEAVWNSEPVPYLRGRDDPWDRVAPHHTWTWSVDRDDLHRMLRDDFQIRARAVDVSDRSNDGRAVTMRIGTASSSDETIPADRFRSAIVRTFGSRALMSTLFDVSEEGGQYRFDGRGYGHGVGLSQWGAYGMSTAGKSYREILHFYYDGVELQTDGAAAIAWTLADAGTALPSLLAPAASTAAPSDRARTTFPKESDTRTTKGAGSPSSGRIQAWGDRDEPVPTRRPARRGW